MSGSWAEVGELNIEWERREIDPWTCYHEIVGVKLEGPPLVVIGDWEVERLPAWAKAGDDLIEIGPYIFRRTMARDYLKAGHYWQVVGNNEWYWHYWNVMLILDLVWRRALLTLAVWGLAQWPRDGSRPTWNDVMRRWRRGKKEGK